MCLPSDPASRIQLDELDPNDPPELRAEAQALLLEYGKFVVGQTGPAQFCFGSLEEEAARLPDSYREQGGGCLVARLGSRPVGFVAWRTVPERVHPAAWELKRLWVRSEGRGLGLGLKLTQAVLDRARAARRGAVYLDTVPASMASAHRLYLQMGFSECEAYNDNRIDGIVYLVKYL